MFHDIWVSLIQFLQICSQESCLQMCSAFHTSKARVYQIPPHSLHNSILFQPGKWGIIFQFPPLRWWEVLCHPTGMCKPSIPPTILHPAACKLWGVPRLQIIKIITPSVFYLAFFWLHFTFPVTFLILVYFRKKQPRAQHGPYLPLFIGDEQSSEWT